MERMPIYQRCIFNKYPHAGPLFYAVLVRLSPGYPPLIGKLHTRYSPVRRSPAMCCHTPLPLDLHVLSLSLAFILSQDQTLRCWFVLCLQPKIPFLLELKYFFWRYVFFNTCTTRCICKSFKELLSILLRVAGAKVRTFPFIFQIFPEVFSSAFQGPALSLGFSNLSLAPLGVPSAMPLPHPSRLRVQR